jgi:transcriptional repressor NrdR
MKCPHCGHEDSQVKDSRPTDDGAAIRRRRQCEQCSERFTTFERIQLREVTVLKTGGLREPFDRDKLARSVAIACRKRPIDAAGIDRLVTTVQRSIESRADGDVTTGQIGAAVMEALKALDSVAYIRFASVYKDFTQATDFEEFAASIREVGRE